MPIDLHRVRGVIFDVDGTLSDTDDLWTNRLADWLQPVRFAFPGKETLSFARRLLMGLETPANAAFSLLDWAELDGPVMRAMDWIDRHGKTRLPEKYWIIPGVPAMIKVLSERLPLAIVSARDVATTLAFLDQFELRRYFRAIATTHTCRHTKPFPHPVKWAAEQMGLCPQDCVMVGDTTVDIRAGRVAGAQTIGVLCGFGTENELRRAGADEIVANTTDVGGMLFGSTGT
jgi:N-acetyl-D-muramate 6-phosphate phosphatase